jgi:uncharacterized protein
MRFLLSLVVAFAAALLPVQAQNETDVTIDGGTAPLKGTLMLPDGAGAVPAVLIIAGSGPTDRNGNSPLGITADTYRLIAQGLAREGIASLRFDKRAVAASVKAAVKEEDLRFETYVNDALSWAAFLQRQPRVSKVFILGHSEGALIGSIAAQKPGFAGFASIAGAGERAGDVLRRQLAGLPPALLARSRTIIDELETGRTVGDVPKELGALFRPSVQPYLISWFKYDPAAEIAKVSVPVLIVQGTTDIQVTVDDANRLAAAKPDATLLIVQGMNHVLKAAPADRAANVATYSDASLPLKAELMPALVSFVRH